VLRPPLLAVALLALVCCRHAPPERMSAEQAVLERQRQGLQALVKTAQEKRLAPFKGVLVVVDETLVQRLLQVGIPYERTVAGRFRISITGAHVKFDDAFALVRLDGRATLADRADTGAAADVSVFGALDIVDLDASTSVLRGRVSLLGVDARRVEVLGVRTSAAEELVEELGREQLLSFADLASALEIPVRLQSSLELPAVGPAGGVTIAAASLPVTARIADVNAFRGKLWIRIDATVAR
jgi:hypothetical protein